MSKSERASFSQLELSVSRAIGLLGALLPGPGGMPCSGGWLGHWLPFLPPRLVDRYCLTCCLWACWMWYLPGLSRWDCTWKIPITGECPALSAREWKTGMMHGEHRLIWKGSTDRGLSFGSETHDAFLNLCLSCHNNKFLTEIFSLNSTIATKKKQNCFLLNFSTFGFILSVGTKNDQRNSISKISTGRTSADCEIINNSGG